MTKILFLVTQSVRTCTGGNPSPFSVAHSLRSEEHCIERKFLLITAHHKVYG